MNEIGGKIVTIAKDAKLPLEFNQDYVKSFRLIGYESITLTTKTFNDNTKGAGDSSSGNTVVPIYELINRDHKTETSSDLHYQQVQKKHTHWIRRTN